MYYPCLSFYLAASRPFSLMGCARLFPPPTRTAGHPAVRSSLAPKPACLVILQLLKLVYTTHYSKPFHKVSSQHAQTTSLVECYIWFHSPSSLASSRSVWSPECAASAAAAKPHRHSNRTSSRPASTAPPTAVLQQTGSRARGLPSRAHSFFRDHTVLSRSPSSCLPPPSSSSNSRSPPWPSSSSSKQHNSTKQ